MSELKQPFVEQVVSNDNKKHITVALSIGNENVFTGEFRKYLRSCIANCLAKNMQELAQAHPDDFCTNEKYVAELVEKTNGEMLMRVGPQVLDTLNWLRHSIIEEGGIEFLMEAMAIATGEKFNVRKQA